MANKYDYRMEEENLVKQLELYTEKNVKRRSKKEIENAVNKWIATTKIKVFNRDKLIERVYEDLRRT